MLKYKTENTVFISLQSAVYQYLQYKIEEIR